MRAKRWPLPPAAPQPLREGDTVTAPSWNGETAKITKVSPYRRRDGSNGDGAFLDNGGFRLLSELRRVEVRK